jgi:hypothetical protein
VLPARRIMRRANSLMCAGFQVTPHDTLGLPPDATLDEAKTAYHKLARQHHPDLNPGNDAATAKMKDINLAYEAIKSGVLGFVAMLVIAIAGSGKTRRLSEALSALDEAYVVIACPTIQLIREVEGWLEEFETEVPVTAIHRRSSRRSLRAPAHLEVF